MYRFDLVFSYWIVVWWVLHMVAPSCIASPKLALLLALAENIVFALILVWTVVPYTTLLGFLAISCLLKGLPLWTVWHDRIHWRQDSIYLGCLAAIYCLYVLVVQQIDPVTVYRRMWHALQEGVLDPTWTPGLVFLSNVISTHTHKYLPATTGIRWGS